MVVAQPRVRVVPVRCAPKQFPCPTCGQPGHRKDLHTRRVRDIAYREIVASDGKGALQVASATHACPLCSVGTGSLEKTTWSTQKETETPAQKEITAQTTKEKKSPLCQGRSQSAVVSNEKSRNLWWIEE